MKNRRKIFSIYVFGILALSGILMGAGNAVAVCPISLPTETVTMSVQYNLPTNQFLTTLSDVPPGYDVSNGNYPGWCIDEGTWITPGANIPVKLYCSYDPPSYLMDDDWDMLNYILNHKQGDAYDVRSAILYFINFGPGIVTPTTLGQAMIDDALANGEGFFPGTGEIIAVICDPNFDGGHVTQYTIIEVLIPPEEFEGKTPGFWKNHQNAWADTDKGDGNPYTTSDTLGSVFSCDKWYFPGTKTLLEALNFKGGPFLDGGARILLRSAVAALLNAAHPDINYPLSLNQIITQVNSALNSMNRGTMLDLASTLDAYNNLGCEDI